MISLKPIGETLVDGENNAVRFDQGYVVRQDIRESLGQILSLHPDARLLPISAASGGAGIFQKSSDKGKIIACRLDSVAEPHITAGSIVELESIAPNQICIDMTNRRVFAGAAISLDQINQAVVNNCGHRYRVLGADLTSYTYAQVGATFMTGGMGPQRRYFGDSVIGIALFDGQSTTVIQGPELQGYAGTYGWTGLVTAVCCQIVELPGDEIAFSMPISNTPEELARLVEHIGKLTFCDIHDGRLVTNTGGTDVILGIEQVTAESMVPMFNQGIENEVTRKARLLKQQCDAAGAEGLVFINGYSEKSTDEFLVHLLDNTEGDNFSIAGIDLEFAEIFPDPEFMRAIREAIPAAARTQSPKGRYIYKNHTDAVVRLNPDRLFESMERFWQINLDYVSAVRSCFENDHQVDGEIIMYGHMNPYGVDPHNRLTMSSENQSSFETMVEQVENLRNSFYVAVAELCEQSLATLVGGEKGAVSELEIYTALGSADHAPGHLREKFLNQATQIRNANPMFSWRAPGEFL